MSSSLVDAVGAASSNAPADVRLVKRLLNAHAKRINLAPPLNIENPHCGPRTIDAIKAFQRIAIGNPQPTGRVKPDGPTIKALLAAPPAGAATGGKVSGKTVGVIPGIINYLSAVSTHYGKEIHVTSGKRSAQHQAEVMWGSWDQHLERGKIYVYLRTNEATRQQLDGYFNTVHAAGASSLAKTQAKQNFLAKVVAIAPSLSRHLTGEAVDVSLSTGQKILDALKVGFTYVEEKYKGVVKCHHFDTRKFGKAPEVTDAIKAQWPK